MVARMVPAEITCLNQASCRQLCGASARVGSTCSDKNPTKGALLVKIGAETVPTIWCWAYWPVTATLARLGSFELVQWVVVEYSKYVCL